MNATAQNFQQDFDKPETILAQCTTLIQWMQHI